MFLTYWANELNVWMMIESLQDIQFPGIYRQLAAKLLVDDVEATNQWFDSTSSATISGDEVCRLLEQVDRKVGSRLLVSSRILATIDYSSVVSMLLTITQANTLRDIHIAAGKACHLLLPDGMLTTEQSNGEFTHTINLLADFGDFSSILVEVILCFFLYIQREISPGSENAIRLEFSSQPSFGIDEYQRLWGCEVLFQQQNDRIVFPKKICEIPVNQDDAANARFADISLTALSLPLINQHQNNRVSKQVSDVILSHLEEGSFLNKEAVSQILAVSIRTMSRRLAEEDTNFSECSNNARITYAKQLLCRDKVRISTVALVSGFKSDASFSRSFKKIVGMTPKQYRTQNRIHY
ncbi:hypothetical protein A9Q99_00110 [Gammaproteobacteria bacterium 45_16_T64]|nr:hypothetical protein A9Q99_00110 [Gammaproteobacteria bacterium 45_16_T64]